MEEQRKSGEPFLIADLKNISNTGDVTNDMSQMQEKNR
jgi:hypothetical protein